MVTIDDNTVLYNWNLLREQNLNVLTKDKNFIGQKKKKERDNPHALFPSLRVTIIITSNSIDLSLLGLYWNGVI